jgi:putative membrane protein (TIGR04086 family)
MGGTFMEKNIKFSCVGAGVLRSSILTLIAMLIYSGIITIIPDNMKVKAVVIMIITCLSVLYGAAYAAKKAKRKGWITGVLVALFYCLLVYVISILSGRNAVLGLSDILRVCIALFVGALSGMLGINL